MLGNVGGCLGNTAPPFSNSACGGPKQWNLSDNMPAERKHAALFWSTKKGTKKHFHCPDGAEADVHQMICKFLYSRRGRDCQNLLEHLGPPVRQGGGWFRFAWLPAVSNLDAVMSTPLPKWRRSR